MSPPATTRPNVIVFLTDQQRWDTTGLHGNPLDLTPNLDRFARHGTHVAAAFSAQPVCGPARSVLQTGRWATASGCYRNDIPLPPGHPTIAHAFNDAGYATGYIGKWHLGTGDPVPPEERGGYRSWLASNILEFTSEPYRTVMYDEDGQPVHLPGYRVDAVADAAIRFVAAHQADPFFLFVSLLEPHHHNRLDDYIAPDGYRERYQGRWIPPDLAALGGSTHQHLGGYYGCVKRIDEAFGRLLDALKSLDLADQTVVVFTSDHGCHFKTRNSEYKRSCHEASIRVPMAMSGPGFSGGREITEPISQIDLAPTLLDAAGIAVPAAMQGRSLLPLVRNDTQERQERRGEAFVQISESGVARAVRTRRWKYAVTDPAKDGHRDPASDRYVETELYDLDTDPYELCNLAGYDSHRAVSDILRDRLLRLLAAAGEAEPRIDPAPSRPSGQRRVDPDEARM